PRPPTLGSTVLYPSSVTKDFDGLRFEAAALHQLGDIQIENAVKKETHPSTSPPLSTLLISSPYNEPGHYLDLLSLDTSSRIFAKALTALKPVRSDYATASYTESLDFQAVLSLIRAFAAAEAYHWKEATFYVVIFRSKLKPSIDNELLYKLDFESHREACESGGLLKYWFGKPDGERQNLATCFWRSREDAYKGGLGSWHAQARAAGGKLYEHIRFSTHRFTVVEGGREFRFEEW
ncbi:hypothetical protein K458DRAFT_276495, partial [Lentithecium fluviatile CBS 122367]